MNVNESIKVQSVRSRMYKRWFSIAYIVFLVEFSPKIQTVAPYCVFVCLLYIQRGNWSYFIDELNGYKLGRVWNSLCCWGWFLALNNSCSFPKWCRARVHAMMYNMHFVSIKDMPDSSFFITLLPFLCSKFRGIFFGGGRKSKISTWFIVL